MCIDIFRFGQRLDIELLVEQIWFSVNKDSPGELDITEIYDVLIKNPERGSGVQRGLGTVSAFLFQERKFPNSGSPGTSPSFCGSE